MVPPVLQKSGRFRCDEPIVGILQGSPLVYVAAQFIDDRSRVVLLRLGRESFAFVENKILLLSCALSLAGLGDRRDEFDAATGFNDALSRLALPIKLPMPPSSPWWKRPLSQ